MHPFGDLAVSSVIGSADADMLVISLCEGDAAAFAAKDDAVFEKFGEGLGAIVYTLMQEAEFKVGLYKARIQPVDP